MASPAYTLTGNFESLLGSSTGFVKIQLAGYGTQIPRISGTGILAPLSYTSSVSGSFSITLWGNDQISPLNATFYNISIYNADGTNVFLNASYQLTGSGSFDLSTLTPLSAAPPPIPIPATVNANTILAGPASGTSGPPGYRHGVPQDIAGVDAAVYVGGDVPQLGASSDICAQINVAAGTLPATGGTIFLVPQSNGANYSSNTPITAFQTGGKFINLIGLAPANQNGGAGVVGSMGGCTIEFTPTKAVGASALTLTSVANAVAGTTVYTGTITGGGSSALAGFKFFVRGFTNYQNNGVFVCSASSATTLTLQNNNGIAETHAATATQTITMLEIDSATSPGDGFAPSGLIEGITFVNNVMSLVNFGSGSSAIGIDATNGARLTTRNVRIAGFGVNYYSNTSVNSWGATHIELGCLWGDINVQLATSENFNWYSGNVQNGGIGILFSNALGGNGGDFKLHGVSFDGNNFPILDAGGSNAGLDCITCHFETSAATAAASTQFLTTVIGGINRVNITGGIMLDDRSSGAAASAWVTTGSQCYLNVNGLTISAGGVTPTNVFNLGGRTTLIGYNSTPGVLSSLYTATAPNYVTNLFQNINTVADANHHIGSTTVFDTAIVAGTDPGGALPFRVGGSGLLSGTFTSDKYQVSGGIPSVSGTGLGTGSASVFANSTDSAMLIVLSPTGSPSASGTVTVTFNSAFPAGHSIVAAATGLNNNGTWNPRATFIATATSTSALTLGWDNNSVGLTAGVNYLIMITVIGF